MNKSLFYILVGLCLSIRFFHLPDALDEPHVWRQADTAHYIQAFHEGDADFLHPAVCWMGGHQTLVLECPIPEFMVSGLYQIFGAHHVVARLFFFLCFVVSALFLFLLIKALTSEEAAQISILLFLLFPLSLFYSRAVHIDFFALACAHGFAYFTLLGMLSKTWRPLLWAGLFLLIGLPVKAPYFLPVGVLLVFLSFHRGQFLYLVKRSYVFAPALVAFVAWQYHAHQVNTQAPDWEYIAGYRKFTDNNAWYFGAFDQRLDGNLWLTLWQRFRFEIFGITGLLLLIPGVIAIRKAHHWLGWWWIGVILYLLIFFNLNHIHNYYQIPFLAPIAVTLGIGIVWLSRRISLAHILPPILVLIFGVEQVIFAEKNYYNQHEDQVAIGGTLAANSDQDDLCIITYHQIDSKCPIYLYAAKRKGWQLPESGVSGKVLYNLMLEGADKYAWVRTVGPAGEPEHFVRSFPCDTLYIDEQHLMYLYDLDFRHIWDMMPEAERERIRPLLE